MDIFRRWINGSSLIFCDVSGTIIFTFHKRPFQKPSVAIYFRRENCHYGAIGTNKSFHVNKYIQFLFHI